MQKRIVVLGGVGFIGTHLCLRLLEEGHEVFCVDIRDAGDSPLLREVKGIAGFRYVHHNITNPFGIRCDEIYNLATPTMLRYDKALPVETLKVNLQGSINALETARTEFARILYASSGDVYGTRLRESFTERRAFSQRIRAGLAEGKRAAEALHGHTTSEYGVDTRIARIFNTYGSGADPIDQRVVIKMIVAALQNRDITVYGSGEQMRSFCWVGDVVDGFVRLMTRAVGRGSTHGQSRQQPRGLHPRAGREDRRADRESLADRTHGGTGRRRKAACTRHLGSTQASWAGCPGHRSQKGCAARSAMRKRSWRTKPTPGSHGRR